MNAHTILSVSFIPADGRGSIDGWEADCKCGFRTSNSLGERWAAKQGAEHVEYMSRINAESQR